MAKITFITKDNKTITAEGDSGSVMELAVENDIPSIEGDCGGVCSCATCHVHVSPKDIEKTGKAEFHEKDTLEFEENLNEYSRLSCQLEICELIDNIVLKVATSE